MSNKAKQVVRVEWDDSCSYHGWWKDGEEFDTSVVVTVGILVSRTKKFVIISSSLDGTCNRWVDPLVIPMSAVRKIKVKGNL